MPNGCDAELRCVFVHYSWADLFLTLPLRSRPGLQPRKAPPAIPAKTPHRPGRGPPATLGITKEGHNREHCPLDSCSNQRQTHLQLAPRPDFAAGNGFLCPEKLPGQAIRRAALSSHM